MPILENGTTNPIFEGFDPEGKKVSAEQLAESMYLKPGTWKEITDAEAAELLKPTEEDLAKFEREKAHSEASAVLASRMQHQIVQAGEFTESEFTLFVKAGLFNTWGPDQPFTKGQRIEYGNIAYEVQQDHTSQAHQPPGSEGMLAVYRPISVDPSSGDEPDGTLENPYIFIYGMDVKNGSYYSYEKSVYLAKADMPACVWVPGTEGMWQWEIVG